MRNLGRVGIPLLCLPLLNVGCSSRLGTSELASSESSACVVAHSVPDAITVTGTAQFQRFNDNSGGLTTKSTLPIRYAEVEALNVIGTRVNCGWTDNSGNFTLRVPRATTVYTIRVNSRALNSSVQVSVLDRPTTNQVYSISANLNTNENQSSTTVNLATASTSGQVLGGAFNIFDQILKSNEFLRANVSGFTVAPKATIYWTAGVTPGEYVGSATSAVSFFNASSSSSLPEAIYILGGISGSVCTDTDHFDNTIIIHEYGHFLEKKYATSDSPGGSHNGAMLLDPRLAWSEGWADFFQGAVLAREVYRDTTGNADCGNASLTFPDFQLESQSQDIPNSSIQSQGGFREFPVARTLFDVYGGSSASPDGYSTTVGFQPIWTAFTQLSSANYAFRSAFLFNQLLRTEIATNYSGQLANFDSIMTNEVQPTSATAASTRFYGATLSAQAGNCSPVLQFAAASTITEESTFNYYLRQNNRYYRYDYTGSAAQSTLNLSFLTGGSYYDLDLYVYKKDHVLTSASTLAGYSASTSASTETVNFSGLAPGTYLIRVSALHRVAGAATDFTLRNTNGDYLCPP